MLFLLVCAKQRPEEYGLSTNPPSASLHTDHDIRKQSSNAMHGMSNTKKIRRLPTSRTRAQGMFKQLYKSGKQAQDRLSMSPQIIPWSEDFHFVQPVVASGKGMEIPLV
jgi:hypothetical protein